MSKNAKDYYFQVYLIAPQEKEGNDEVKFNDLNNAPKCILTKKVEPNENKENKENIIKIFKYVGELKDNSHFEFTYDNKNFKITFESIKDKTFIFDLILQEKKGILIFKSSSTIDQKVGYHDKLNYFIESLNKTNEDDKLDILYSDSIKIYSKKLDFRFLINLFINVYNNKLCGNLLNEFSKNLDKSQQKENILKDNLENYRYYFDKIYKNIDNIFDSNSSYITDFYGLILCYLNNFYIEKYNELFNDLYKKNKNILLNTLLKYKYYFKNQNELSIEFIDEIIKFAINKNYKEFKENGLFYLKTIEIFLDIIEKNKEKIIKIDNFEPIELAANDQQENIDLEKIINKMDKILNFSNEKKILLVNFKSSFWEIMAKKCSIVNRKNIEICFNIRQKLIQFNKIVNDLFGNKKDNPIYTEISKFYKKGLFIHQLDKSVKEYIETNDKITNNEIIYLIKEYDIYYKDKRYLHKRDPDILKKIDLEKIENDFIGNFQKMEFEKIFSHDLENYLLVLLNKIKTIADFDIIVMLIDINKLDDKKNYYLKLLKNKYKNGIKSRELLNIDEKVVKSLANLSYYICVNENKLDFLEKNIQESNITKIFKHKIYTEIINICKINNNREITKFISEQYFSSLNLETLKEFVEFLTYLSKEDLNNFIYRFNDKYIISEDEFYCKSKSLNISLLNSMKQKLDLNEDNKYMKSNFQILEKILRDIEKKEIKYEYIINFCNNDKEIVMEKLEILSLLPEYNNNTEEIYENFKKYNKDMNDTLKELSAYKSNLEYIQQEHNKNEILAMNKYIADIKKGTYNYFYKKRAEIQNLLDETKETYNKVNDIKNSKIFKLFYQKENSKKSGKSNINPFEKAYSEFKEFKKSLAEKGADFINKSSNENNQDNIIKKIIEQNHEDQEFQKELISLIHNEGKNDDEFNLTLNYKIYENDLNSTFYFLKYFHNIKDEIHKLEIKCKQIFNKKDISEMKNFLQELIIEGIYDYTKENNMNQKSNYLKVFNSYYEQNQAIDFLYNHNTEDIKHLYEKIQPNNRTISTKDITDTYNCVGFFQDLKQKKTLKEILEYIKLKMNQDDTLKCFNNYINIYRSIIELNQNFDFSLHIYEEIDDITKHAKFIFNKNSDEFKYKSINKNKQEEIKIITIDKIKELKNKIQIREGGEPENENSNKLYEKYKQLKFFKNLSNNIEEIYNLMTTLRIKGSTLPLSIRIEVINQNAKYFLGKSNVNKKFEDIQAFLTKAKNNIVKKLESIYKDMTTIRFIYGKQIDSILSHIQGNYQIDSFLRYILNLTDCKEEVKDGQKAFGRNVEDYINEIDLYNSNSFNIIHNYILNLFKENNLTIEKHYKNISIKNTKENPLKGIYKYFSESSSMEEDILQIFLDKVGKIPIAQNILINNKETSFEEMQSFFNRAILCKYNTLFVVKVNNSFSDSQQRCMNIFIDKLLAYKNELYNKNEEGKEVDKSDISAYMDSCLVFVYNKESESFLNELKNLNPKELPMYKTHQLRRQKTRYTASEISSKSDYLREQLFNNTHIVQSEICGLGKSTKIKNEIRKMGKKCIYFPLGGNVTKDKIYNRLEKEMKKLNNNNNYKDIAIHLDLFESKEHSILNEFLFSFLITKFYSNNVNIIYIPVNIEIFVEIPNCFNDFISNYEILKFFKREDDIITLDNLPELNLPTATINIFNNMLGLKNNKEIFNWVKDNIKISRYSYHQVHMFINLFISQYDKFSGQKLLFLDAKGNNVTQDCINSFAEGTKYFTYGNFSKLLLQNKEKKSDIKYNDIDILSQEYQNDLKNQKYNTNLIFIVKNKYNINENKKYKHIYYNLDISYKALKNGEALYKLNNEQKEERKKKINSFSQDYVEKVEYLNILKEILNLKNPVEKNNTPDGNEDNKLISLLDIIDKDEYVMTIDNFRKMILILYRIIANIPVILMGETGCGKTALIKKLNKLLNNGEEKLECINIDPSYTEDKLIEKMKEVNEKAKKYNKYNNKDTFWVFFDELNTCDSLSLITEIFINRSYDGNSLNDNIRLIGACNPYRRKKQDKIICGLTYPNDDNELVYLVNILPQSLMYYVFNFGSLEKSNEDLYISSIISDIIKDKRLKEKTQKVISKCHEYLRNIFDPSIVSLREMTRFKKIYNFFINFYKNKNSCLNIKENKEAEKLKSIIISIYLCYYIRLINSDTRTSFDTQLKQEFKNLVNYTFSKFLKSQNFNENDVVYDGDLKNDLISNYNITDFNSFHFSDILSEEENFLLDNITLDKGIGKNKSLKENLFLLFTSLATHIPLIIIGKPGSSKSLSAQLICKEMNGKYSKSEFFRKYPSILQSYFQDSDSTTAEEVEGIFKIAEGRLNSFKENEGKPEEMISMILFDELGLAERSKYNPLKALHSNLEIDGNKKGISFVGISNWTLDAAKVNRALVLSVPDLDVNLDDLKSTSKSIAKSIDESFDHLFVSLFLKKFCQVFIFILNKT